MPIEFLKNSRAFFFLVAMCEPFTTKSLPFLFFVVIYELYRDRNRLHIAGLSFFLRLTAHSPKMAKVIRRSASLFYPPIIPHFSEPARL